MQRGCLAGRFHGCLARWYHRATYSQEQLVHYGPLIIVSLTTPSVAGYFTHMFLFNEPTLPAIQSDSYYYLILQKREPGEGV